MKVQNLLLTIISLLLTVICLQNAGLIPQSKSQDVNIDKIGGEPFENHVRHMPTVDPIGLPVY